MAYCHPQSTGLHNLWRTSRPILSLRRGDAARHRRAEIAKASVRRQREEGSGLTKPVPAPKSGGAAKGRSASRGPGGWRGPKKDWKCSQYDPFLFCLFISPFRFLFNYYFVFHYPCSSDSITVISPRCKFTEATRGDVFAHVHRSKKGPGAETHNAETDVSYIILPFF